MGRIDDYPRFAPLSLGMADELRPFLDSLRDGMAGMTFANLLLFRARYHYEVARLGGGFVLRGRTGKGRFFSLPGSSPGAALNELLGWGFWKDMSAAQASSFSAALEGMGASVAENRDDSEYVYSRLDLKNLSGKKFHKKKNLVNACRAAYRIDARPIDSSSEGDALAVLDIWAARQVGDGKDAAAAREALALREELRLEGTMIYADGAPAAWSLGETLCGGKMFATHFEKGDERFKGIYQLVNQESAARLPPSVEYINREQDLGDEGLRQAKMTYRPRGFVVKYDAFPPRA